MSDFEWNDTHVEWFTRRFGSREREINASDISNKYTRKKGEPKFTAQDYRNLMQKIVQNRLARATRGYVTSKSYSVRMVSSDYPYVSDTPDACFFALLSSHKSHLDTTELGLFFPEISSSSWSSDYIDILERAGAFWNILIDGLYAYKYLGGDFYNVFHHVPANEDREFAYIVNWICLEVEYFIRKYELIKSVCLESEVPLEFKELLRIQGIKEPLHNYIFVEAIKSHLVYEIWRRVGCPGKKNNRSFSASVKKRGEILRSPGEHHTLPTMETYSEAFEKARLLLSITSDPPLVSHSEKVTEARKALNRVFSEKSELEQLMLEKCIPCW